MKILEAKAAKAKLENDITDLVRLFELNTGLKVSGFNIVKNKCAGLPIETGFVNVTVELP